MFMKISLTYLFVLVQCFVRATSHLGQVVPIRNETCGGSYNTDSGSLETPNYPYNYSNIKYCIWTISIPSNNRNITLTFDSFETESGNDILEIRAGQNEFGILIGRYSGYGVQRRPNPITIASGNVWLKFTADSSAAVYSGFRITWNSNIGTQNCGAAYTGGSGTLQSPHYPSQYMSNEYCVWTISPYDKSVNFKLTFSYFETGSGDILEIREGNNSLGRLLGNYSGNQLPASIEASSLWIRFTSNSGGNFYGFKATWRSPNRLCNLDFNTTTGSLTTPYTGYYYEYDVVCLWRIIPTGTNYRRLTLTFDYFQADSGDVLEIRDGLNESGSLVGRYSGSSRPSPLTVYSRNLWLQFTSNPSSTYRPFVSTYNTRNGLGITWTTDIGNNHCGYSYSYWNAGTVIQSSNYPFPYYNNEYCVWTIGSPDNNGPAICLKFDSLDTEFRDYVEIYEGTSQYGYFRGRYSGNAKPDPIHINSGQAWIRFTSDSSRTRRGFQLSWRTSAYYNDCYDNRDSKVGLIVGCTVGGIAFLGLFISFFICRRRCCRKTDGTTLASTTQHDKPVTSKIYDRLTSYPFVQKLRGWKLLDTENVSEPHSNSARLMLEY